MAHRSHQLSVLASLPQQAWAAWLRRRLLGEGVAAAASRARLSFLPPPSAAPAAGGARALPAPPAWRTRAGLANPTKEPRLPPPRPPRPGLPAAARPAAAAGIGSRKPGFQVPGGGRGPRPQPSGGCGRNARPGAPRLRGAASPAVRRRDWPGPLRRPPLIGGFSNSVSRRQRRCFSGDPGPGLQSRSGRRGVPASEGHSERGSARFAFPARCCHPAADRIAPLVPRGCGAVEVPVEAGNLLRKAGVVSRAGGNWGEREPSRLGCQPATRPLLGWRGIEGFMPRDQARVGCPV